MEPILFETERMTFRRFTPDDREAVSVFLMDPEVMYAWEHGFSEEEVTGWMERNSTRYDRYGYGWLYAEDKETSGNIGAIGLLYTGDIAGEDGWELGYIVNKRFWGKGYAAEGARGCIEHAFRAIGTDRVFSQMRTSNAASRAVAARIGMDYVTTYDRLYHGETLPYHVYVMKKTEDRRSGRKRTGAPDA